MAKGKVVRTLIVGLGRIGWDHHIKKVAENPRFEVTAVVDTIAARRKEAQQVYGCRTFATLKDALKADVAQLAVICTRSVDHCAHTIEALRAGCHVLVEKPAAMSVREMDRMMAAAKKARRVLTVNQSARKADDLRFIRETIDSKLLGKVFWIRLASQSFFRRNDWQQLKRFGGGYLNNNGVHAVDGILRLLDGPVESVWGDLKHTVTAGDADDFLKVVIRGKDGRLLEVEQSYACAFPEPKWLVCGTYGSMRITGEEATIKYFDPKKAPKIKVDPKAPADRQYGNDDRLPWKEKAVPAKPKKAYPDLYDNLYKAVRRGTKLLVTPESVRETIGVLDAVRKSSLWK
ncbi:MAG: Gfo/Idh/MocA family oxidoreductase [Planctomycetes bacterium]|nr:Gfo/Idh/MocA family oxidoreductase [Planctomycetota bacterium]